MRNFNSLSRRYWLSFVLFFLVVSTGFAQTTVKGNVSDDAGPIIGGSVIVKGTTTGVITDFDGNFTITVPDAKNSILQFSYMGYETQEVKVNGRKFIKVSLSESSNLIEEVTIVAYGVQKKETLTGAVSSVKTEDLLVSPNASVANSLAGKMTGLSSVQSSGAPGAEDPAIYIRGVGSLTEGGAQPLILVDGVERSFFQMDPNEIENITVLKDASATAVFGVRGANGVILVTTRRGKEGKAKISVNSSIGLQTPTRTLEMADSYTYATLYNELQENDGRAAEFSPYDIERFKLGDQPIMYPNIRWRDYLMNKAALQTQHNMNISGGTDRMKYFVSVGYLFQNGLFKNLGIKDEGYKYNRYNYRANIDMDITKTTTLKLGIGGVVGDRHTPAFEDEIWRNINWSQPFASPGIIDDCYVSTQPRWSNVILNDPISRYYKRGYKRNVSNTMNLDLHLVQKLDFLTKGLSVEVKGAYNTTYNFAKSRSRAATKREEAIPYYKSEVDGSNLRPGDPGFDDEIIYRYSGTESKPEYGESTGRGRNWYFEASVRYNRKFGNHNVGGLFLYNQSKKYYPKSFSYVPAAYIGFVGRLTYDYKSRYMAEFNIGYNGSENFAPDKRFGTFPAVSLGYIMSEEKFMKNQNVFDFLKFRASVGLVGNDNMNNNRFLYLPDGYNVNLHGTIPGSGNWKAPAYGYYFGFNKDLFLGGGALEKKLGNRNVTWETALKQNYGVDMNFLNNRLKVKAEYFLEKRKDILISRETIPAIVGLNSKFLPAVNMGKVKNQGYEIEISWNDKIGDDFTYFVNGNVSYAKNKIEFQDEVEPNEPYLWRTGKQVGAIFGFEFDRFYTEDDFNISIDDHGKKKYELKEGFDKPLTPVYPGDAKYKDLNNDNEITPDDQHQIGFSNRPNYTFGLNLGFEYKNFFFSMNWLGTAERSMQLSEEFRKPFNGESRGLMQFHADNHWTPETAATATQPRFSKNSNDNNYKYNSTLWTVDASYLKLKNVTIGYNFRNKAALKKLGINQLGIKFTAYNPLCFDHFNIMDPESNPNHYGDTYPVVKIYNLGVNLSF